MGQALYRKWRPQTFDDVVGQEHIVKTLQFALRTGRIHHAYLLAGPRGTGKTTTARLIAKAVNCLAPEDQRPCSTCEICTAIAEGRLLDLLEIDAASHTGVDNIRDLLEKVGFRPAQARYKVYVIDEVHMLSTAAFNALLKTLEEPPEHVIFVLATTEPHKIPETILSRCQRYEFRRIPLDAIVEQLGAIAAAESVEAEPQALEIIARSATGSMRDAISLFDQMSASGTITADYVRSMLGTERREVVKSLLEAWAQNDLTKGLEIINRAIDSGADPRQLARQTADFMRGLLLMRLGAGHTWSDPIDAERERLATIARDCDPNRLVRAVRLFSTVASKQRTGWQPQLPLELAFVEATVLPQLGTQASSQLAGPTKRPRAGSSTPSPKAAQPATKAASKASPAAPNRVAEAKPSVPVADAGIDAGGDRASGADAEGSEDGPEPAAAPSAAAEGTMDVRTIRSRWPEILRTIRPVTLGALLRDADIGGVDGDGRLVLAFQHEFHCTKVSESANLHRIEDIVTSTLEQPIVIRCLLADDVRAQGISPSSGGSGAAGGEPEIPLEEDELIRRAQEELGAVARVND